MREKGSKCQCREKWNSLILMSVKVLCYFLPWWPSSMQSLEQIHRKGTKPHRDECSDIFKIWARMNVFRKVFGIFLKRFSTNPHPRPPSPPPKCNDSLGEKLKYLREGFLLTLNFFFISTVNCKNIREALMKFAYLERR